MLPATPTRLSMTTGCFHASDSLCPRVRPMMSEVPPGANGTITRMAFEGYAWPAAGAGANRMARAIVPVSAFMRGLLITGWRREAALFVLRASLDAPYLRVQTVESPGS